MTTTIHPASDDPVRNERFRLGIEGSGIGVWDLDLSTHRLLWSNSARALFGVPIDLPLTYELFLSLLDVEERERTQQRMSDWVRLSPKQRNEARLNYQGAQQLSAQERQDRWEAYKALPEEQRRQLASKAKLSSASAGAASRSAKPLAAGPKDNTVSNPLLDVGQPHPVRPGMVQAKPGVSTRSIASKPAPPLHQQAGLPKVAATPEFVDSTTLLPQRGAQGVVSDPRRKP